MEMVITMIIVCIAILVATQDENSYTNFTIGTMGCLFDFICFAVVIYIIYVCIK